MPGIANTQTMPWATRTPKYKKNMTAGVWVDASNITAVSFDTDVILTVRDREGNEDAADLPPFPTWEGLDTSVIEVMVDVSTVMHCMGGK